VLNLGLLFILCSARTGLELSTLSESRMQLFCKVFWTSSVVDGAFIFILDALHLVCLVSWGVIVHVFLTDLCYILRCYFAFEDFVATIIFSVLVRSFSPLALARSAIVFTQRSKSLSAPCFNCFLYTAEICICLCFFVVRATVRIKQSKALRITVSAEYECWYQGFPCLLMKSLQCLSPVAALLTQKSKTTA